MAHKRTGTRFTTGGSANRGTQASLQKGGGHTRRDSNRRQSGRSDNEEMSDSQVVGFLGRKIWQSMNDEDGDISDVRIENFNYYNGKEYGDERAGYSQFVTRETLETVEWVLPSILRVFLSGDRIVSFDPVNPEDEAAAKQETDIANYFLMKANNRGQGGFVPLHHWMKDCLMYPNGYIKCYMEEYEHTDVSVMTGLNDMGVQMIMNNPETTILEQRSNTTVAEGANPLSPPVELFDLRIRTTKKIKQLRIDPVPGEECLIDNDCVTLNLDEADFVCHRVRKSYTQLVNEGHDSEELDQVGIGEDYQWNDERTNRLFYEDEDPDAEDEDDPSMRMFWVHECYAYFDFNGDGLAEFRRVVLIGDKIFENEETNYQPMIAMSAILMQHKHTGMSFIDIVKDLQLLNSVLVRQLLDNVYKTNVRKKIISEDALLEDGSTMEALLNVQAEFIPVRGLAGNASVPEANQSVVSELLPVIQYFKEQPTNRTGVSPELGVDPNSLQEVRQEVYTNALDRASQRIEMLTRIFAETGFRTLMLKVHQQMRSHWDIERAVKLRGEWVDVDPQGWRDRTDVTVNTGLGFNPKNIQLGLLTKLLEIQREAAGQGMSNPSMIHNTLEKMVVAAGIGDAKAYFIDPASPEFQPPQPQPDPQAILAQAQAQALTDEQQRKKQEMQIKAQSEGQKNQQDFHIKQNEIKSKQIDQQLKQRELSLRERELHFNMQLKAGELRVQIPNTQADTALKRANADKAIVDASANAVEGSETYLKALEIVTQANDANEDEEREIEIDLEGDGNGNSEAETGS